MAVSVVPVFCWLLVITSAANWEPQMMKKYFAARNVHSVDAAVCTQDDEVQLFDNLARSGDSEYAPSAWLFRVVSSFDVRGSHHVRVGIFIDLSCAKNVDLLKKMRTPESKVWFEPLIFWLIWDGNDHIAKENLETYLPLSSFSEVVVGKSDGLNKMRKLWRDHPVEITEKGRWNDTTQDLIRRFGEEKRIDFQKSAVRASITFFQDVYDRSNLSAQLQDVSYKSRFDTANRLYYTNVLLLEQFYNFTLEMQISPHWGDRLDNGSWTGTLGLLQREEIDFNITPMIPMGRRLEVSFPTLSLAPYWIAVVFKQPRALGTYKAMILELSSATWACILGLLVIGAFAFSICQKPELETERGYDNDSTFAMGFVQTVGILCNQGLSHIPQRISSRIVCLSLLVVGLIISTYYSAATMTALLSPSPPTIRSIEELLHSHIPVTFRNSSIARIKTVRERIFPSNLWALMEEAVGEGKLFDECQGVHYIANGSAFVDEFSVLFQTINDQLKSDTICDLTVFKVGSLRYAMMYVKKDPHYRDMHFRGLLRLLEHGLMRKERQKWLHESRDGRIRIRKYESEFDSQRPKV